MAGMSDLSAAPSLSRRGSQIQKKSSGSGFMGLDLDSVLFDDKKRNQGGGGTSIADDPLDFLGGGKSKKTMNKNGSSDSFDPIADILGDDFDKPDRSVERRSTSKDNFSLGGGSINRQKSMAPDVDDILGQLNTGAKDSKIENNITFGRNDPPLMKKPSVNMTDVFGSFDGPPTSSPAPAKDPQDISFDDDTLKELMAQNAQLEAELSNRRSRDHTPTNDATPNNASLINESKPVTPIQKVTPVQQAALTAAALGFEDEPPLSKQMENSKPASLAPSKASMPSRRNTAPKMKVDDDFDNFLDDFVKEKEESSSPTPVPKAESHISQTTTPANTTPTPAPDLSKAFTSDWEPPVRKRSAVPKGRSRLEKAATIGGDMFGAEELPITTSVAASAHGTQPAIDPSDQISQKSVPRSVTFPLQAQEPKSAVPSVVAGTGSAVGSTHPPPVPVQSSIHQHQHQLQHQHQHQLDTQASVASHSVAEAPTPAPISVEAKAGMTPSERRRMMQEQRRQAAFGTGVGSSTFPPIVEDPKTQAPVPVNHSTAFSTTSINASSIGQVGGSPAGASSSQIAVDLRAEIGRLTGLLNMAEAKNQKLNDELDKSQDERRKKIVQLEQERAADRDRWDIAQRRLEAEVNRLHDQVLEEQRRGKELKNRQQETIEIERSEVRRTWDQKFKDEQDRLRRMSQQELEHTEARHRRHIDQMVDQHNRELESVRIAATSSVELTTVMDRVQDTTSQVEGLARRLDGVNRLADDATKSQLDQRERNIIHLERMAQEKLAEVESQRRKLTQVIESMNNDRSASEMHVTQARERVDRDHTRVLELLNKTKETEVHTKTMLEEQRTLLEEERRSFLLEKETITSEQTRVKAEHEAVQRKLKKERDALDVVRRQLEQLQMNCTRRISETETLVGAERRNLLVDMEVFAEKERNFRLEVDKLETLNASVEAESQRIDAEGKRIRLLAAELHKKSEDICKLYELAHHEKVQSEKILGQLTDQKKELVSEKSNLKSLHHLVEHQRLELLKETTISIERRGITDRRLQPPPRVNHLKNISSDQSDHTSDPSPILPMQSNPQDIAAPQQQYWHLPERKINREEVENQIDQWNMTSERTRERISQMENIMARANVDHVNFVEEQGYFNSPYQGYENSEDEDHEEDDEPYIQQGQPYEDNLPQVDEYIEEGYEDYEAHQPPRPQYDGIPRFPDQHYQMSHSQHPREPMSHNEQPERYEHDNSGGETPPMAPSGSLHTLDMLPSDDNTL